MQIRARNTLVARTAGSAMQLPDMFSGPYGQGQMRGEIARFEHDADKNVPPKAFVAANVFRGKKHGRRTPVLFKNGLAVIQDVCIAVVKSQACRALRNSAFVEFGNKP